MHVISQHIDRRLGELARKVENVPAGFLVHPFSCSGRYGVWLTSYGRPQLVRSIHIANRSGLWLRHNFLIASLVTVALFRAELIASPAVFVVLMAPGILAWVMDLVLFGVREPPRYTEIVFSDRIPESKINHALEALTAAEGANTTNSI